jgi:putative intracellular protease/amidase
MKKITLVLLLIIILPSFRIPNPKVLLYIQDNSADLGFMLKNEAVRMKEILEQKGHEVVIATLSGDVLKTDMMSLKPDLKLNDVNIKDYSGFIIPCMAVNDTIVKPEEKTFVKKIVSAGKPLAAQNGGVLILAKAGVLSGKKYAIEMGGADKTFPEFKGAIYIGNGVVQDGKIITSGTCPMMAKETGNKDGTDELTYKLAEAIKAEN